ncbi:MULTISPECIES: FKBP-type peptidyl-prolyl cis-trans isomerase [unclassified Schlesneria]|uniref:FKBP-type peptidyl-prolyl cis-trans isomerase n=1 Tax=Schlesneria TaxID=656899 RepID=UPI002F181129
MKRLIALLIMISIAGCEPEAPPAEFPPIPQAPDTIRVEPGPTDPDAPTEFTTTESGLKYRILRKSDGQKPTASNSVRVHYRGSLDDGTIFDSSYGRTGKAIEFAVTGVIPGWTEGLQLIGEGGMIELEIPPELGYGNAGFGTSIPPNSTLHFIVELLNVKK